jgi:phosphoribosyl 1,2-cyclic phosphodiesterase
LAKADFSVRFWGVRGSIPCPGPETVRYGGNTSCVEIRCGEHLIVFDGGTGMRPLGKALDASGKKADLDIFFSHTHHDHIGGLLFFSPCYAAGNQLRIWAGHLKPANKNIRDVLKTMMSPPLFPVPVDIFAAKIDFIDFSAGETLKPYPDVTLKTAPLNHPNGATGYRIEYGGKSIVYLTDVEHVPGESDPNVLSLMHGADIAIYDCTYDGPEFDKHRGWGHSTWQEGVRLADEAKVKQFVIFHHDPDHDDAFMDKIAAAAEKQRPGTVVAKEGMVLRP